MCEWTPLSNGVEIGVHYDPLLAKIISYGMDRATALRKLDVRVAAPPAIARRDNQSRVSDPDSREPTNFAKGARIPHSCRPRERRRNMPIISPPRRCISTKPRQRHAVPNLPQQPLPRPIRSSCASAATRRDRYRGSRPGQFDYSVAVAHERSWLPRLSAAIQVKSRLKSMASPEPTKSLEVRRPHLRSLTPRTAPASSSTSPASSSLRPARANTKPPTRPCPARSYASW